MEDKVNAAAAHVAAGGLICFPTETLWSLSCAADDQDAVQAIFAAKQRPEGVPLALGVPSWEVAKEFIHSTPGADSLASQFMPGPISLVCKAKNTRFAHLAPGFDTLSIRVPDHPVSLALLAKTGPMVMTSANRHGAADPLTAAEVRDGLAGVPNLLVLEGEVPGTGSTVVDATGPNPVILREGVINQKQVAAAWP